MDNKPSISNQEFREMKKKYINEKKIVKIKQKKIENFMKRLKELCPDNEELKYGTIEFNNEEQINVMVQEQLKDENWNPVFNSQDEADTKLEPLLEALPKEAFHGHTENVLPLMNVLRNCGCSFDFAKRVFTYKRGKKTEELDDWKSQEYKKYHSYPHLIKKLKEYSVYDRLLKEGKIPNEFLKKKVIFRTGPLKTIFDEGITHKNASDLFFELFPKKYYYDSDRGKHGTWYYNNEYGIWKKFEQYIEIDRDIDKMADILRTEIEKIEEEDPKKLRELNKILKSLETATFIESFRKCLKKKYSPINDKQVVFNNIKGKLFAFDNGVMELETGFFRNALPEEYISETCGRKYEKSDESKRKEVINILRDIYGSDEEVKFMNTFHSLGFSDKNKHEVIMIHVGDGRNGKGVVGILNCRAYGKYAQEKLNKSYITVHKFTSKSGTDSVMANLQNKKYVICPELEHEKIDIGLVKDLCGGGLQSAIKKYDNDAIEFVPGWIIHVQTNKLPDLGGNIDNAIKKRFLIRNYPYIFTAEPVKKNEKLINEELKTKIREGIYDNAMFDILLSAYQEYLKSGSKLNISSSVKEDTANYFKSEDSITTFIEEQLQYDEHSEISASDLYSIYKNTYNGKREDIMTMKMFCLELSKKGIEKRRKIKGMFYVGYKIRDDQFDLVNSNQ